MVVVWKSSKQGTATQSTTESEYAVASGAAQEAIQIRKFIDDVGVMHSVEQPTEMYCDNEGVIVFAKEPRSQKGNRHVFQKYTSFKHGVSVYEAHTSA